MIIYVSSYLTVGKNVCVYFEKSGFCFSIVQLSSVSSRASVVEMWLNQCITKQSCQGLELKICFSLVEKFQLTIDFIYNRKCPCFSGHCFIQHAFQIFYFGMLFDLYISIFYIQFSHLLYFEFSRKKYRLSFAIAKMDTQLNIDKPVTNAFKIFIQLFFNFINIFMLTYKACITSIKKKSTLIYMRKSRGPDPCRTPLDTHAG